MKPGAIQLQLRVGTWLVVCACGGPDTRPAPTTCDHHSGMGVLADFDVPCDPGGEGILFTASGEDFARNGYAFPPLGPDDVVLVDGWAITYDRVLTTFDHITLSRDPDKSPTDQSLCSDANSNPVTCGTDGSVLAEVDGPFVVDLHKGGPLAGADGGEQQAVAVAALTGLNKQDNAAFDPTTKYAVSFEVVPASLAAKNINLDAGAIADYQQMVDKGYTTLLVGTATWRGNSKGQLPGGCTQTQVAPAYDFSVLPKTIHFRIGLPAPTAYRNAQNPALAGQPISASEEHPRGVGAVQNRSTIAQLTFHLDHVFWESFVHDAPAHFDPYAARYAGTTTPPTLTLEDFKGYGFKPVVDAQGHQVPWRSCLTTYTPPSTAAMAFDTQSIAVDPHGDPAKVIRDFYDYVLYNHSTFGHLNADGLSFVDREYPSPP